MRQFPSDRGAKRDPMLRNLLEAPDFVAFLRYWDACRRDDGFADWDGSLTGMPEPLLPTLVVIDAAAGATYRYFGSECARRLGHDPTGRKIGEVLSGLHRGYILSLLEAVLSHAAPI